MPRAFSRLAEALQENARLKARQGQTGSPSPTPQDDVQVQRLRALLREAEDRERALRMEVEQTRQQQVQQPTQPTPQIVKTEEPEFFLRMPGSLDIGSPEPMVQDRRVFSTKEKERHGGPGLSLMVGSIATFCELMTDSISNNRSSSSHLPSSLCHTANNCKVA